MLLFGGINEVNGDPLRYKVEGGTVAVIGCDENASGELVIPSTYEEKPVTSIGAVLGVGAFKGCSGLTSVTIPDSVIKIGDRTFLGCSGLTSVTIPDSVTTIGNYAFIDCSGLTSVTIPASVTSIGTLAFWGCNSLTSVTISSFVLVRGIKKIFPDSLLNTVSISKGVTSIGNQAFFGCGSLKSVTIPDSVTSIGERAFWGCSSLTSVTIPDSVTSIENGAFSRCSSLTSITFEGNVPTLGIDVFVGVSGNAKIFINPGATGFGETYARLPVQILKKLKINTFSKSDSPFSLSFETKSESTYKIEASHDLKQWREIGEVQGTGSSVKFTDWREALFQKQYYRVKMVE